MEHKKNKKTTTLQQASLLQVTPSPLPHNKDNTLSKRDILVQKAVDKVREKEELSTKE